MKFSALLSVILSVDKSSVKATFINHFCEYDCILLVFPPIQSVFISFFHYYFDLFLLLPLFFYSYRIRPPSTQFPSSFTLRLSPFHPSSFTQFPSSYTQLPSSFTQIPSFFRPVPSVFHPISFVFHPVLTISFAQFSPPPLSFIFFFHSNRIEWKAFNVL